MSPNLHAVRLNDTGRVVWFTTPDEAFDHAATHGGRVIGTRTPACTCGRAGQQLLALHRGRCELRRPDVGDVRGYR